MKKVFFVSNYQSGLHRGVGFYATRLLDHLHKHQAEYDTEVTDSPLGCDLVHYPYFDLFRHTLPLFSSVPKVVSVLDVIPLEYSRIYQPGFRGQANLLLQKLSLAQAKAILTLSNASRENIHKYLQVPKSKITVTYLAADPVFKKITNNSQLQKIKLLYKLPDKFVLYVGGINYNKNLPNLVQACKQALLPLVIVGKESLGIEKLNYSHPELRHLKNLDLSAVIRLGFVSTADLVGIYNLASVYCQPSFSEGFGLSVLEALACQTPVAVSNTSSLPEIVGDNGHYFDPRSPADISRALLAAIGTYPAPPDSKFSWDNTASQTLQVYNSLLCH